MSRIDEMKSTAEVRRFAMATEMKNQKLLSRIEELEKHMGHLLWLIEVEYKIDGQHITADARKVLTGGTDD